MVNQPPIIYQEQFSSKNQGLALWDPRPIEGLFNDPPHISIGDVGYLDRGVFIRIFNVKLPRKDQSNTLIEIPEEYEPLEREHLDNVRRSEIRQEEYCSHVSKVDNVPNTPDEYIGQTYECWARSRGALLSLPHGARTEDVLNPKLFEVYIRDNVVNWFRWSKKAGLPVENMEDLILVTGCTLARSWAAAVFDSSVSRDSDTATISLEVRKSDSGGVQFVWRNIRGSVEYHHSDSSIEGPPPENQCVFIRGFRAKRILFRTRPMRAAAEPLPDDPDNRRDDDETQVTRIPSSSKYRDPLVGMLDYIIEECDDVSAAKDIIAIADDDDLQLIEGEETPTADAIEKLLTAILSDFISSTPNAPSVHIHSALAGPSPLYDMRSRSNPRLSPAVLATPASSPRLPSPVLRVGDPPWLFDVWPDAGHPLENAVVTVRDVLLAIYFHLCMAAKGHEYRLMSKFRKLEIFRASVRVSRGHGPNQMREEAPTCRHFGWTLPYPGACSCQVQEQRVGRHRVIIH